MDKQLLNGWDIVVVEDDADNRELITTMLQLFGANVHTAINGEDGFKTILEVKPKFVISDLSMPYVDGWTMIANIQKNRATMHIPVIALTAHAMQGDRERAIAAGFQNYLTKPLSPKTFFDEMLRIVMDVPQFAEELRGRL